MNVHDRLHSIMTSVILCCSVYKCCRCPRVSPASQKSCLSLSWLGCAGLGWAGLGWDVEIIEEFLLRNPGAGCPWWWVYNSVLTPRVLMYSHKKPQRRGPQYNLSINHRDTAARRPDGLHRTHHHQPTHIMSTHTHTSTHYLHTSTHYLSTSTHHCQCHTTQHRSWQGSLILHILQANASQPSHSLSYHWSFIYW